MKTIASSLRGLLALSLPLLACTGLGAATITFTDSGSFADAFPTTVESGVWTAPSVSDGQAHLLTGATEEGTNRSGAYTAYSAASYAADLDFSSDPVTLSFSTVQFVAPNGTAKGKLGLTDTASGKIDTGNGLYFVFTRASSAASNTFELVQSVNGSETTLATFRTGNALGPAGSVYGDISLTVSATTWSVSYADGTNEPVSFVGTWASANWGATTYIGLESAQNSTATGNPRTAELNVGAITIGSQIPEPGAAAGLAGLAGLAFATLRRRRAAR